MVVRYMGGLGNQLFQYAFGKAIQKEYGCTLKYDRFSYVRDKKRKYELDKFNITNEQQQNIMGCILCNALFYLKKTPNCIFKSENGMFDYSENTGENSWKYYLGYWQNARYFENIVDELKQEFTLKKVTDELNIKLNDIQCKGTSSVSMHIRRGDYLNLSDYYMVLDADYYRNAMQLVARKIDNPVFYCFSDDISWCKSIFVNTGYEIHYMENNRTEEDFALMRCCKNHIISNSTFSWWAAFLNDNGIRIAPRKWFHDENINQKVKEALLQNFIIL